MVLGTFGKLVNLGAFCAAWCGPDCYTRINLSFNDTYLTIIAFGNRWCKRSTSSNRSGPEWAKCTWIHSQNWEQWLMRPQLLWRERGSKLFRRTKQQRLEHCKSSVLTECLPILTHSWWGYFGTLIQNLNFWVQEALTKNWCKNRPTCVIAHRLSTIQHAGLNIGDWAKAKLSREVPIRVEGQITGLYRSFSSISVGFSIFRIKIFNPWNSSDFFPIVLLALFGMHSLSSLSPLTALGGFIRNGKEITSDSTGCGKSCLTG